ncbi:MAG: PQQ-dependent sugar dehydrogenase [Fibrobacteria bacterium]
MSRALIPALTAATMAFSTIVPTGFVESKIATGFNRPTQMEIAPDGRIFVLEQGGTVRIVKNGALLATPFITLSGVFSTQDYGLDGIAFDPAFATNNRIYLYVAMAGSPNNYTRILRVTANGDVAVSGSETEIFRLDDFSGTTHQGGALHFGKDGKLYVFTGTPAGTTSLSQNLGSTIGKALRINSDGTIPTDNPFYTTNTGRYRAIYARGLRNPFTAAIQPGTGRIFYTDVGEDSWEEINDVVAAANYGWPAMEGNSGTPPAGYKGPFYTYAHSGSQYNSGAVLGACFYNPAVAQFPSVYIGKFFYADHTFGTINYLDPLSGSPSPVPFATGLDHPLDIKVDADGKLYYLVRGNSSTPSTMNLFRVVYGSNLGPTIDQSPNTATYPVGEQATFCVSASGTAPLSYKWQRNSVDVAGATGTCYTTPVTTLADHGTLYRAIVSNPWGTATSNSAILNVTSNQRPLATITAPAAGAHYNAGDILAYSGTGSDPEDGTLGAAAFSWWINFHHNTHAHSTLPLTSGSTSGSIATSVNDEKNDNVWFRVHLRVTDAGGLTDEDSVDVTPNKTTVTVTSNPPGIQLIRDGAAIATPLTFISPVGIEWNLSAPATGSIGGTAYKFVSWSDGLAADHKIYAPAGNPTYTANYVIDDKRGFVLRQVWNGITGTTIASLTGNANYPYSPSATSSLTLLEGPTNVADNYGSRIVGQLYPPTTGAYTFWIAADDVAELWLGTSESPSSRVRIATVTAWTNSREWTKSTTQKSATITLTAGKRYHIEALQKEGTGGDNLAVSWSGPGIAQQVIPGTYLSYPDPLAFSEADIGTVGFAGSRTVASGAHTVKGAGADIWGTADAFHFSYSPMTGDGEIRARVSAVQNTNAWAKAGVMMRENVNANARNLLIAITPGQGTTFQRRLTAGGSSTFTQTAGLAAPYWVRLVRAGNLFSAYRSIDGITWTLVGQETLALPSTIQVGLAVTSHDNAQLGSGTFDNVKLP